MVYAEIGTREVKSASRSTVLLMAEDEGRGVELAHKSTQVRQFPRYNNSANETRSVSTIRTFVNTVLRRGREVCFCSLAEAYMEVFTCRR